MGESRSSWAGLSISRQTRCVVWHRVFATLPSSMGSSLRPRRYVDVGTTISIPGEAGNLVDVRALPPMRPEKRPSVSKAWEGGSGRTSLLSLKGVLVFWCLVLWPAGAVLVCPALVASWLVCFPFLGCSVQSGTRSPKASEQAEQRFSEAVGRPPRNPSKGWLGRNARNRFSPAGTSSETRGLTRGQTRHQRMACFSKA